MNSPGDQRIEQLEGPAMITSGIELYKITVLDIFQI